METDGQKGCHRKQVSIRAQRNDYMIPPSQSIRDYLFIMSENVVG